MTTTVNNKNVLQNIRDHEMDRKDFLKYSGIVLIGIVGLKGLLALLAQPEIPTTISTAQQSKRGFGSGKYGE
jgi:hypothetical protein